jgi:hypothetical protein
MDVVAALLYDPHRDTSLVDFNKAGLVVEDPRPPLAILFKEVRSGVVGPYYYRFKETFPPKRDEVLQKFLAASLGFLVRRPGLLTDSQKDLAFEIVRSL